MKIDVQKKTETDYSVSVIPDTGLVTQHRISLHPRYHKMLTGGKVSPKELITMSFEFLLKKESNDSILPEFELSDISQYFSDYEQTIKKGFKKRK